MSTLCDHFISFAFIFTFFFKFENRIFRDVVSAICLEVLLGIPLAEKMSIQTTNAVGWNVNTFRGKKMVKYDKIN